MSVQTQAMARGISNASQVIDGQSKGDDQESPKDAAAKFQSMMNGLQDGKSRQKSAAPGDRALDDADQSADQSGKSQDGAGSETSSARGNGSQSDFSTTNLTDAIRKVSQTVLAKTGEVASDGKDQTDGTSEQSNEAQNHPSAIFPATLTLKTVLAATSQIIAGGGGQMTTNQNITQPQYGLPNVQTTREAGTPKTGTSSLFAQFGIEPESVAEGQVGRGGAAGALPADAADTVKVLRQETHFAPNLRLSPAQQVGEQLSSALKEMPTDFGRAQTGLTTKAEGPVLKTLDIQLTPHELGTVKVSLRMVGDTVEVQLITSRAQTAELLKQDRQMLDQMLRTTGFNADTITIQAADDRGTVLSSSQSGNSSAQNQNGNNTSAQFDGQRGNQNGGGSDQPDNRSGEDGHGEHFQAADFSKGQDHEDGSDIRLSDGIYL
ncbi:MAG: flagellar hook-length control protein FliK [Roseibium sp.]